MTRSAIPAGPVHTARLHSFDRTLACVYGDETLRIVNVSCGHGVPLDISEHACELRDDFALGAEPILRTCPTRIFTVSLATERLRGPAFRPLTV